MQVTVVGCAGSVPGPDSAASCYLVQAGGFTLVADLGSGAIGALQRYVSPGDVDAVFLSHLHADHCLDMTGYSVYRKYGPRAAGPRRRIPVYGPAGAAGRLQRALGSGHEEITEEFDFVTLAPGTVQIGPLRLTTARMAHPVETFGARIEHDGQVLAYSADTGPCEELTALARGADVLLAEATFGSLDAGEVPPDLHLTARQAAEHAGRAGAGQLVLTHLAPWTDARASLEQAGSSWPGPAQLARPGLPLLP